MKVSWIHKDGAHGSHVCYCIKDARDFWDKINGLGCKMVSRRP